MGGSKVREALLLRWQFQGQEPARDERAPLPRHLQKPAKAAGNLAGNIAQFLRPSGSLPAKAEEKARAQQPREPEGTLAMPCGTVVTNVHGPGPPRAN